MCPARVLTRRHRAVARVERRRTRGGLAFTARATPDSGVQTKKGRRAAIFAIGKPCLLVRALRAVVRLSRAMLRLFPRALGRRLSRVLGRLPRALLRRLSLGRPSRALVR